jgi:hypothetical protein
MNTSRFLVALAIVAVGAFLGGRAFSEDEAPSEAEVMEWMMKMGQPGEPHKRLAEFGGSWDAAGTFSSPSMGEMKSTGKSTNAMILDGRYLKMDYEGQMMGAPFVGTGFLGYNNIHQRYEMLWIDNWSTQLQVAEGTCIEEGTKLEFRMSMDGPKGAKFPMRMVFGFPAEGKWMLQNYSQHEGKEVKDMEIVYTRSKE